MSIKRNSNKSYKIEDRFGPITLAAAILGLVLGVIESFLKIVSFVESRFYFSVTVLWAFCLVFARYYPSQGLPRFPVKRNLIIAIATILFLASISVTYYEHHLRTTEPARRPHIKLSRLFGLSSAEASQQTLTLTSFYLNEDLCSFEERKEPLFAAGKIVKTYSVNRDVIAAFRNGNCVGVYGERPMIAARTVIRNWLTTSDRSELREYLDGPKALGRLARERGDIFDKIIPSSEELVAIKHRSPEDYVIIKKWILSCVGVYQPVFTATLANTSSKPVDIVEVQYETEQVGQVLGAGLGGPVWPEMTYDHTLIHSKGVQPFLLKPVFNIPAGVTKAFNLRLHTNDERPGLGWYLRIKFIDSTGSFATTEKFQIYLNPK
jgi:hypothetical protein